MLSGIKSCSAAVGPAVREESSPGAEYSHAPAPYLVCSEAGAFVFAQVSSDAATAWICMPTTKVRKEARFCPLAALPWHLAHTSNLLTSNWCPATAGCNG